MSIIMARIDTRRLLKTGIALGLCFVATTTEAAILAKLNEGQSLTISAIGTSLTATGYSYWFDQMGDWLDSQYPGTVSLANCAVCASASKYTARYTSPDSGLDVQLGNALSHNPDAVFIEFAMNDAYPQYGISQRMSKDNLQAMIDQINAWGTTHGKSVDIILQTMNNAIYVDRPNLVAYYQGYRDVAAANELLLVDNYVNWLNVYVKDFARWQSYVPDNVHPNALGSQNVILPAIERALTSQVPEPSGLAMLIGGMVELLAYVWRRRRSPEHSRFGV
jgi:lysophospholipase L1-like esterase